MIKGKTFLLTGVTCYVKLLPNCQKRQTSSFPHDNLPDVCRLSVSLSAEPQFSCLLKLVGSLRDGCGHAVH